jgi:hypothetical protein
MHDHVDTTCLGFAGHAHGVDLIMNRGSDRRSMRLSRLTIPDLALIGGARPDPTRLITCGE